MTRPGRALALAAGLLIGFLAGWWLRDGSSPAGSADAPRVAAPEDAARPREASSARPSATPRRRAVAADDASPSVSSTAGSPDARPGDGAAGATPGAPGARAGGDPARPNGDSASSAASASPAIQPADPSPAQPLREAQGVVIDAASQAPVAGARVLFAVADGPKAGSWWGDTTDASGRFHNRADDVRDLLATPFELRVSKDGFEPVRVAASGGEQRIELRQRTTPVMPGRVAGIVRTPDGRPFAGEVEIEAYDENGNNVAQRAVADAGGAFVLEGVAPGSWRMRWNRGAWTAVTVAESGDGRVDLVAAADGASAGFTITDVDPATVTSDDSATKARLATLVRLLDEVGRATELDAAARERVRRALAQEVQQIVADGHASLPRRDLVVTVPALAAGVRAWIRLETHPRHFRRAEVQSGVARFPATPIGAYTAVLAEPGRPDRSSPVTVAPGEGALEWEFR